MTIDNIIKIKGGSYIQIKKALKQWIDLYAEDLPGDFYFELYKNGRSNYIIKVDEKLDNDRFYFLVNYLNYPEGIEYTIDIEGFIRGKDENELKGKELLIWISPNDKEYDNVFAVTTDNKNYKIDFGGKISLVTENKLYHKPEIAQLENPEFIKVNKHEVSKRKEEKSKDNIEKRFKFLLIISALAYLIGCITLLFNNSIFTKFTFFIGIGLGTWFFSDYKMLQVSKYYFYCLLLSLAYFGLTIIILNLTGHTEIDLNDVGVSYPITLLVIQAPLRLIFKAFFNREPVIEKPPPTFWDGVYMISLFLGFALFSLAILG